MLVARRDPPFHVDARDAVSANFETGSKPPRVVRFVTVIQMIGSLVAVPVGIGSAYTFYRANFSPETTCQSLRSGIIAMLDKGVDASTRRVLVRRDVETFEKTCATVDPEATAAFKTLLAAEKSAAPIPAVVPAPKAQPSETVSKEPVHKAEPRPQPAPKQAVTNAQPPAAQSTRKEPVSDTQWLDAVRQALVTHQESARPAEGVKARPAAAPSIRPAQREVEPAAPVVAPAPVATSTPAASAAAPVLPPPVAVVPTPAQQNAVRTQDPDHPVPPQSIPDAPEVAAAETKADEPGRSKIGKWISAIPLLGPVIDNGRH
ncbi:MAG TPA: hypothetical protein VFL49_10975 [Pseudolabrys sp.]|nr:hypothetical protein [Pseudolabrys sp.]